MIAPLSFVFSTKDPNFTSSNIVVSEDYPYISHAFVQTVIYDEATGEQIGYKVSDDYVQQVSPELYVVRLSNTYTLTGRGTLTWNYTFTSNTNSYFYPTNQQVYSTITSGTGEFYGTSGTVRLFPSSDGSRSVQVIFNS